MFVAHLQRCNFPPPSFLPQIKETRQAIKDSESGLEKMAIGHHIQDRGHVVEKKINNKTGEGELNQDFHNLDECTSPRLSLGPISCLIFQDQI